MSKYPDYLYKDNYLVIFKEGNDYKIFESEDGKTIGFEGDVVDENELSDIVNDICCKEQKFELMYYNPNLDKNKYIDFLQHF
jgi:hypothetical protein